MFMNPGEGWLGFHLPAAADGGAGSSAFGNDCCSWESPVLPFGVILGLHKGEHSARSLLSSFSGRISSSLRRVEGARRNPV